MTSSLESLWRTARALHRGRSKALGPRAPGAKALPPLLFFTDPARIADPETIVRRLPRGSGIVYRAFGAPAALAFGRRLARVARERGVAFLVGADPNLARALRADGLHWPERLAFRRGINLRLRRRFLLTGAAHGPAALVRSRGAGLDALVVSSIFPSSSPSAGRPVGPRRLAVLVRDSPAPVYALGGVDAQNARRLIPTGVIGVAAVEALAR
jgi:thiamine-phosphate pyrophosphorylase